MGIRAFQDVDADGNDCSVRYWVGVTLLIFLKIRQKYAVSLYPQLAAISFNGIP